MPIPSTPRVCYINCYALLKKADFFHDYLQFMKHNTLVVSILNFPSTVTRFVLLHYWPLPHNTITFLNFIGVNRFRLAGRNIPTVSWRRWCQFMYYWFAYACWPAVLSIDCFVDCERAKRCWHACACRTTRMWVSTRKWVCPYLRTCIWWVE